MADDITIVVNAEDNFSGVLGNFGSIMTGIESAVNLAGQAFEFAKDVIGDFVNSASDSEIAVTKLEAVIASSGNAAGVTSEELQGLATNMMNLTGTSDEAQIAAETMLLRFENINEDIFPQTLLLANDLSAALGIDLTTAAQTVGKALDDPEQGIGRLNMQFKLFNDTEMENIKTMAAHGDVAGAQALIMERLTEKIGGTAEALGETFQGRLNIAKEKFDNLKETIGGAFLPVLTDLMERIGDFMDKPEVQAFIQWFAEKLSVGIQGAVLYFDMFMANLKQIGQIFASGDIAPLGDLFLEAVNNVDWDGISNKIADFIASIDWGKVGNVIAQGLGYISIAILDIIKEIDWGALAGAIGQGFADLIAGLFGFVDWSDMISSAEAGFEYVETAIEDWVRNFLTIDVVNGFKYMGEQIKLSIANFFGWETWSTFAADVTRGFQYVIDAIKDFLGISSPSTVFAQIGMSIVQGLINGFLGAWEGLLTVAKTSLSDFFDLFGIDFSDVVGGGSMGSHDTGGTHTRGTGGTTGGGTGTGAPGTSGAGVVNNFYGPVYFNGLGQVGYDCPDPNPLLVASAQGLNSTGF